MKKALQLHINNLVQDYKMFLAEVISKRPSGIKRRLAEALNTNPSFISQITSPNYRIPIPLAHLPIIIKVLHLSKKEKNEFLRLYHLAHPMGLSEGYLGDETDEDKLVVHLPRFKDKRTAREVRTLIEQFANRIIALLNK